MFPSPSQAKGALRAFEAKARHARSPAVKRAAEQAAAPWRERLRAYEERWAANR